MQVPQVPHASHIQDLQKIGTLEQLNLHFQITPPREDVVGGYLYSGPVHWTGHDPWNARGTVRSQSEVACQKDVVDWILTLALPYLRGIPSITLSGHIKNSTRAKWERMFANERKGVVPDMSAERQSVRTQLAQPFVSPLTCFFSVSLPGRFSNLSCSVDLPALATTRAFGGTRNRMVLTLRAENPPRFLGRMTLITTSDSTTGSTVRIQKERFQNNRNSGAS
jgi:hypothetical protein